jgi:DNA-binding GntR family transcriptional regulator
LADSSKLAEGHVSGARFSFTGSLARGTGEPHRAQSIYAKLRELLMAGTFRPGQKLTLREVAGWFETSLTPARDALLRLVAEQVLQMPRNGTIIVPIPTSDEVREVRRIRCELEGLAVQEAAGRITEQEVETVCEKQRFLQKSLAAADRTELANTNRAFHFSIYQAAEMPVLLQTIENFWLRNGPLQNLLYANTRILQRKSLDYHQTIIKALIDRDRIAARQALVSDIMSGTEEIIDILLDNTH